MEKTWPVRLLLFDLDDTLYGEGVGLFGEVRTRIELWLMRTFHFSLPEAQAMRARFYTLYGTTLAGLQRHHPEVDLDDYLDYVHDVPIENYVHPDPRLAGMLARLSVPKVIFTNATQLWALRILQRLDVADSFEQILDIRATGYMSKPRPEAYARALEIVGQPGPACVLLDDQPRNLQGAAAFGIRTILVRSGGVPGEGVAAAVNRVLDAEPILQQWLEGGSF